MIVLFVVVDSLKADAPGFGAASGCARTPYMDGLARDGAVFEDAFTAGAWTIPSLMSMLTGSLAHRVGLCRWRHPYPAGRPNLLTAFRAAGFETVCFHPYPEWGFLTIPGKARVASSQRPEEIESALRGDRGRDLFVLLHHWWTHIPYLNRELSRKHWHAACDYSLESLNRHPAKIAGTLERSYLKAVSHFSEELLPRYMDAAASGGGKVLLVLTGDHGETWGASLPAGRRVEHVFDLHGRWITDETTRIPLLIHGAGGVSPGGRRITGFASGVDFAPTIAELAGVPWPGETPKDSGPGIIEREGADLEVIGQSLAPFIESGRATHRTEIPVVSSHNTHVPDTYPADGALMWRTMAERTPEAWYIWDGADRERTILPLNNSAPDEKTTDGVFARLEARHARALNPGAPVEDKFLDSLRDDRTKEVGRRLRSLGYLE